MSEMAFRASRPSNDRCIFIVGCDRSGTTLLQNFVNAHPTIHVTYEARITKFLPLWDAGGAAALLDALRKRVHFRALNFDNVLEEFHSLDHGGVADLIALMFRALADQQAKPIWGDKTPQYTNHIGELSALWPNSVFLHIARDPRAVADSWVRTRWGPNTIYHCALEWRRAVGKALHDMALLPRTRKLLIRYEDLVTEPRAELENICSVIGVPFSDKMMNADERAKLNLPSEYLNNLHPRHKSQIEPDRAVSWKNMSSRKIAHIESLCHDLMATLDYVCMTQNSDRIPARDVALYKVQSRLRRTLKNWAK